MLFIAGHVARKIRKPLPPFSFYFSETSTRVCETRLHLQTLLTYTATATIARQTVPTYNMGLCVTFPVAHP